MLFLWLKALHIIALVCWFAGLFYLPRLFVYHAMSTDEISHQRFCIMERKLYRGIMLPSMLATLVFGICLLSLNPSHYFGQGWMHAKLSLVLLLVIYQFVCAAQLKAFARGDNRRGHLFYRWFNEAPVLALLAIVILVVVKPF
jgi:protoporphyrinogen IX oxidase